MMKNGGRDLEGRSCRKELQKAAGVSLKKLVPGYEEGGA
jgi:hypothetical protein